MSDDDLGKLFRALPEEDPPNGGMAALMAAATAKAREMAPPPKVSLFARFVELFKRPPVLAFATIVVLIGGAVIVKRHGDTLDVAERAVDRPAQSPPAAVVPPTTMREAEHAPAATPTPESTALAPEAPGPEVTRRLPPAAAVAPPKPSPPPPAKQVVPATIVDRGDLDVAAGAAESPPPNIQPPPSPTPSAPPRGMAIATDDVSVAGEPTASAKSPAPVSAEQLLHECQSAAHRGDCAAVRRIASKIQTSNTPFYRERVVKDAAIAKCLP